MAKFKYEEPATQWLPSRCASPGGQDKLLVQGDDSGRPFVLARDELDHFAEVAVRARCKPCRVHVIAPEDSNPVSDCQGFAAQGVQPYGTALGAHWQCRFSAVTQRGQTLPSRMVPIVRTELRPWTIASVVWAVLPLVVVIAVGISVARGRRSDRVRIWRCSLVLAAIGVVSVTFGGVMAGNDAFFYIGGLVTLTCVPLAVAMTGVVYRDREAGLDPTRNIER